MGPKGAHVVFRAEQLPDGKLRASKVMFQSKLVAQTSAVRTERWRAKGGTAPKPVFAGGASRNMGMNMGGNMGMNMGGNMRMNMVAKPMMMGGMKRSMPT